MKPRPRYSSVPASHGWPAAWFGRAGDCPVVLVVAAALVWALAATPALGAELVYYHERGCPYCEQWEEEVLPIYHKTPEGQRLPLRKVKASEPWPEDLAGIEGVMYTPTFILVTDAGEEVGRITGYRPDYFWPFLDQLIEKLDARKAAEK